MSKKILVVIDPGHKPNANRGAAPGYYEGNKMFTFSEYEKEALERYGIDVIMTRTYAENPALYDRGQVAVKNGKNYDEVVFLSNHSNGFNGTACGVIVFRSLYLPDSTELGQKLVDAIVGVMKPVTGVTYSRGVATRKGSSGADYYGVIRGSVSNAKSNAQAAKGPVKYSYIVEHGFHDHAGECAFLNVDANLKKMAEAEAKAIADYFGVSASISKPEAAKPVMQTDKKPAAKKEMYRVRKTWTDVKSQIGAFTNLSNAKNMAIKNPGYKVFDSAGNCVYPITATKTIEEIAREVIAGKWYSGAARKSALTKAGYDYYAVQKKVNELL